MRLVLLTKDEREALERMARTDAKPYRRERALAILAVAGGEVASHVAREGRRRSTRAR